jgi:hypothetical protein
MKRPFLIALALGAACLLLAFAPVLLRMFTMPPGPAIATPTVGAPWQVELPGPGRSRVFGLNLPGTTLAETRQRWSDELRLALIAGRDGSMALEGYVERFESGGVSGRLLLTFDSPASTLQRWRDSLPGTPLESGGRQHALSPTALEDLAGSALSGLSFIPVAQLDAQVLTARFGAPAERLPEGDRIEHWLYPALGLAVALDAKGRDVLQYVAPADFERALVAPLRRRPAASAVPVS